MDERRKDNAEDGGWTTGSIEWTLGYLSAYSHFGGKRLQHTDANAIKAWLDKFCAEHPLVDISDADDALIEELHKGA